MTDTLIQSDNKVWRKVTVPGLMSAHVTVEAVAGSPTFDWFGPKIPLALWRSILSFFKWSQDTHHCETQVRLFLNTATGQWRAWAFPQEKGGMSTKEIQGKEADDQRAALGAGYQEFGSVHHHCSMGAFQSGTDHTDESDRPGIHLTVGNLDSTTYSLHSRALFVANGGKVMYKDMKLDQWFESPAWLIGLSKEVMDLLGEEARSSAVARELARPSKDPFPEAWKTNLIERKWETTSTSTYKGNGPNGYYTGMGGWGPTQQDKDRFIDDLAEIMDDHNISVDEIEEIFEVANEIHDLIMKSPRINWPDTLEIIMSAIRDGSLEKIMELNEVKAGLMETPAGKDPIVANGMTQKELDEIDEYYAQ